MNQTNRILALLFNESDSAASQLKRKRELDSPSENNDILGALLLWHIQGLNEYDVTRFNL